MRGFRDVHAHMRVNVDSLLAVFGHPSLAPSPLYHCHIWKTTLTAWAPFCKYNRPSTVGKHNRSPSNAFSRLSDWRGHRARQVCAPKWYTVLSWHQGRQLWHIEHPYIWKHKQWRNALVMPMRPSTRDEGWIAWTGLIMAWFILTFSRWANKSPHRKHSTEDFCQVCGLNIWHLTFGACKFLTSI